MAFCHGLRREKGRVRFMKEKNKLLEKLAKKLPQLTEDQLNWLVSLVDEFEKKSEYTVATDWDLLTKELVESFRDILRIHHCFSKEPFTKDKFEYALESLANKYGFKAVLAQRVHPGHDITINNQKFSLKTQADKSIRADRIHISKFMELGKGRWGSNVEDLRGLVEQFFNHMKEYDRILVLRNLSKPPEPWKYELVEIPKGLLLEAKEGKLEMCMNSRQSPKPGYCRVFDNRNQIKFELYFDGGSERKLQIKSLDKKYCVVHATWTFSSK
jgi:type II restriction enzyme